MPLARPRIEIRPFDPHTASRSEWANYHAYRRLRGAEDFPDLPLYTDADFEHEVRRHLPLVVNQRLMAVRGDEIVGNVLVVRRREGTEGYRDHAPYIDVGGGVLTPHRRQGVGRALFAALHEFMQDHGQSTASLKIHLPEGHAFMAAAGAALKLRSVENRLALLDLDWNELARWQAHVADSALPLRWEIHAPRVPLDRLATLMAPFSQLINQQPLGDLDIPVIRYDLAGYAAWYAELDRNGGEHYLVMLTEGGEVAATCEASWDPRFPDRAHQALTAVAASWRGQGLAKAVKAAMLLLLRERRPDVNMLFTLNANANAPMLSINRRLGFRVHREMCTYQIGRGALAAFT